MSKAKLDQHREQQRQGTHLRCRSTRLALKLTEQRIEESKQVIEASRKLLDQPVYPYHLPKKRPDPEK